MEAPQFLVLRLRSCDPLPLASALGLTPPTRPTLLVRVVMDYCPRVAALPEYARVTLTFGVGSTRDFALLSCRPAGPEVTATSVTSWVLDAEKPTRPATATDIFGPSIQDKAARFNDGVDFVKEYLSARPATPPPVEATPPQYPLGYAPSPLPKLLGWLELMKSLPNIRLN